MFDSRLHKGIDNLFIFKFYLLFSRVHIDVQLRWIKIDKQYIQRIIFGWNHFLVSAHYSMVKVGAFDKAIIYKEILVTSCFLCCFWFTYKAVNVQVICVLLDRNQS